MKRLQSILVLLLTICLMSFVLVSCPNTNHPNDNTNEQINVTKTGYTLVWNDEFTTSDSDRTPLSTNWGYDIGAGLSPCTDGKNPNNWAWGNNELQWYSDNDPDNTYVSDGTLKIVAKKEQQLLSF